MDMILLVLQRLKLLKKFPLNFIDFVQMEAPKTLADIHPDEALLLSTIKDFIKPFKEQYKKITSKNREIKEHNTVVHEIYIKIKNKGNSAKINKLEA